MSNTEVKQLEQQKEQYEKAIKTKNSVAKLMEDPIFKEVILEEYCVRECARYLGVAGTPAIEKDDRELALEMAKAGQHLRRWLEVKLQMGQNAEDQMAQLDAAIDAAEQGE